MHVGRGQRGFEAIPATDVFQADPDQRQESRDDEEKLEDFVVDGAGESAQEDVAEHDDRGEDDGEVEDPVQRQSQRLKRLVEDVERLDEARHRIHRNAGREDGHQREGAGVPGARLFVEAEAQKFGHGARFRAVVERHHEDADEDHRGNGADPVKVAGDDAVFGAGGTHADDFLRAKVGGNEGEAADPGGQGAAGLEVVLAGFHEALECEADAEHKNEIQQHDDPVDGCQVHALGFLDGGFGCGCRRPLYTVAWGKSRRRRAAVAHSL